MATARFDVEKFNGKNDFGLWRIKMKAMLVHQGLADAIRGDSKEKGVVDGDERSAFKKVEIMERAHSAIILCLSDKVLREVSKETTAAGVWLKLESLYMTKSLANRLYMKQRLYSYRFAENRTISEQLDQFNKFVDDLEDIDVSLDDEDKAIILLNALPQSYDQLKDAMLYGRETSITLLEVQSALKSKEFQKHNSGVQDSHSEALNISKYKGKKQGLKMKGGKPQQPKAKDNPQKETRECFWCKKPGHLKKNCFAWKKKIAEGQDNQEVVDLVEEVQQPLVLNVIQGDIKDSWIMDSGCSFHMSAHREWFQNLEAAQGCVLLGNDQTCQIMGIGNIKMQLDDGSSMILTEVRYIPDIKRNLISLGVLELKGCQFMSQKGIMTVLKNSQLVMKAVRKNSLYYLLGKAVVGAINVAVNDQFNTWHRRLGHVGMRAMKGLTSRGVISISEWNGEHQCEDCILGKSKKLPFKKGKHTSKAALAYAHSDLWGPAQTLSEGGGRYFLSIIDDYSRKLWVYILKEKSDAFSKFKDWCAEVELEKGSTLKCLRTDNGLEFLSADFNKFCSDKGIKRHRTVPSNPQQNGVAERMNRTILERVRCMLISSGMPRKFWAEAVTTAAVLINKCPSSAVNYHTPDGIWYGSDGDYMKLRTFGCAAYAHIKRGKLEARAQRCVFLGYQPGVQGYRLWCVEPRNHKLLTSRDVIFDEGKMPYKEVTDLRIDKDEEVARFKVELHPEDASDPEDDVGTQADPGITHEPDDNNLDNYLLARDRKRRQITPPSRYSDNNMVYYALTVAEDLESSGPNSYREAMEDADKEKWILAMQEEIQSLMKNGTWILVDRPMLHKPIGCKWVFKRKHEAADGNKVRFKARLVAKGYSQKEGIDYNEVFSPVVKHSSIRILLGVVAQNNWELQQLDVKTAFLHGDLEETIYMLQPEGFIEKGSENKVCLLKKSLYGLKQSSRQWYRRFDEAMGRIGFTKSKYDNCVYIKHKGETAIAHLLLYVDDMLVAGPCKSEIEIIKQQLQHEFEMKDLGEAKRILGMDIIRRRKTGELWLMQTEYIKKLLLRFRMSDSKGVCTPLSQQFKLSTSQRPANDKDRKEMSDIPYANIIGSIMYTMVCTRPDLSHAVSVTSRFMADHGREHWLALKWILRYLKKSANYGILYKKTEKLGEEPLVGYCDSDYAANLDNRRSQTGYIFNLYGSAISWKSNLQSVVALSTTEAEYIALTEAVKESMWLKGILKDFGIAQQSVSIHCDSNSALCLAKHHIFHERSKHIDIRMHFIRDEVEKGNVKLIKVGTDHNAADMLTKSLPAPKFSYCLELVNVMEH
ncbi:Integrase catalytic domain-containing protein [Salvia divinorum]|uniref:Integrase catalytic domain-containing protein n=1 Tax=Salvia divinorum TaxID=28513 RepID=A0ABD1I7L5_SALDI